jgi:hypothetical protein
MFFLGIRYESGALVDGARNVAARCLFEVVQLPDQRAIVLKKLSKGSDSE